jgi:hypothetical protein
MLQSLKLANVSESTREHLRHAVILAVAGVVAFGVVFLLRWAFVRESTIRADYPEPARPVDPVLDRRLIRATTDWLVYNLQNTCRELCGLSAVHVGLPIQVVVLRSNSAEKGFVYLMNPVVEADAYTEWDDALMSIGDTDPLCRKSRKHWRSFRVARKVRVSSDMREYMFTGGDARCVQQLAWTLRMNSSDDWPCELTRWRDVEFLPLYSAVDV